MSATTAHRAPAIRSPFIAIVAYTLRSCLPLRRRFGVGVIALGAPLFGLMTHVIGESNHRAFAHIAVNGIFTLVVPIAALVVGDAILGAEIRAGTFHFTWLSPVSIWQIVLGRWVGGSIFTIVALTPACILAAVVAGDSESAWPIAMGAIGGSFAYIALFLIIGSVAKRTAVWSLIVVFLVERLLGTALAGIAQLSPTWESQAVFIGLVRDAPDNLVRDGIPDGWSAMGRLVIITGVCLALARWRMGRMQLESAAD
jgi:ABC-type transport system involved in multi-copper enzyme maturation permease subunit